MTTQKRSLQVLGIVLKRRKIGEFDNIITFYSPALGKVEAKAKGARKIENSFCSQLETLNVCRFQLYKKNFSYTITQATIEKNYKFLRENFEASILSLFILEIFQKITREEEPETNQKIFNLLTQTLDLLEKRDQDFLVIERFKLQLLFYNGILPNLFTCENCHKKWDQTKTIYLDLEGHLSCCSPTPNSTVLNFNIIKLFNFLLKQDWLDIKISLKETEKKQIKAFTDFFLHQYLGTEIQSETIVNQLLKI